MSSFTLENIKISDLEKIFSGVILFRGRNYARYGNVFSLKREGPRLKAMVQGTQAYPYRVNLQIENKRLKGICSCPYVNKYDKPCKHMAAALIKWIESRDTEKESEEVIGTSPRDKIRDLWLTWIPKDANVRVDVNLHQSGPGLEIHINQEETERKAYLIVPPVEVPSFIQFLRTVENSWEFNISPRVMEMKIYRKPLKPRLHAKFNENNLHLIPEYYIPGSSTVYSLKDVQQNLINSDWFWDNKGFRKVLDIPVELKDYFEGRKPLIYTGQDVIDFIEQSLPFLLRTSGFSVSQEVSKLRIISLPVPKRVKVESGEKGWLWLDPKYEIENREITLREILESFKEYGFFRLGSHIVQPLLSDITSLQEIGEIVDGKVKTSPVTFLRSAAEWEENVEVITTSQVDKFLKNITRVTPLRRGPRIRNYEGKLRPYQKIGFYWLYFLRKNKLPGILADEMGLGKTHQVMVLLSTLYYREKNANPSLIVCPTSVLDHWENKMREFIPKLRTFSYYGLNRELPENFEEIPVVITTYPILRQDIKKLKKFHWHYVILDEAQYIKNPRAKVTRAARMLDAEYRLCLTGTPMENRPLELWSLFNFLIPGYLYSEKKFKEKFENPIVKEERTEALNLLKRIVHPFKLRRTKEDVIEELPPKIEDMRYCRLSQHQIALYKALVEERGRELVENLRNYDKPIDHIHIFALLTKLKRLCDHPKLVLPDSSRDRMNSGKFELFKELILEALDNEQKIVVFSQYLEMLDIMEKWADSQGIRWSGLRGSTKNRGEMIREFQENPECKVFFASLLAGGLGIDLTAASVVLHYDRWWNPARENQATDRVHRIGQGKIVHVIKLITRGTLEEKIDKILKKKEHLFNTLITSDKAFLKKLTREELIEILNTRPE